MYADFAHATTVTDQVLTPLISLSLSLGEFWLGLEKMSAVAKDTDYILKVKFSDWRGDSETIQYPIRLGGEESHYALHIQETSNGNLESALATEASGLPFSTRDQDNDQKSDTNCAKHLSGTLLFIQVQSNFLSEFDLEVLRCISQ